MDKRELGKFVRDNPRRVVAGIGLVLFLCFIRIMVLLEPATDTQARPVANSSPKTAVAPLLSESGAIEISATQLLQAYQANEVRADDDYKGKIVKVSGEIRTISKDFLDHPYISIRCGDHFDGVHCDMTDGSDVRNLNAGQSVVVLGVVNGLLIGDVQLEKCRILSSASIALDNGATAAH